MSSIGAATTRKPAISHSTPLYSSDSTVATSSCNAANLCLRRQPIVLVHMCAHTIYATSRTSSSISPFLSNVVQASTILQQSSVGVAGMTSARNSCWLNVSPRVRARPTRHEDAPRVASRAGISAIIAALSQYGTSEEQVVAVAVLEVALACAHAQIRVDTPSSRRLLVHFHSRDVSYSEMQRARRVCRSDGQF